MHTETPARIVIAALTAAIIVILAVASRTESNPCAWSVGGVPLAKCAVALQGGK